MTNYWIVDIILTAKTATLPRVAVHAPSEEDAR